MNEHRLYMKSAYREWRVMDKDRDRTSLETWSCAVTGFREIWGKYAQPAIEQHTLRYSYIEGFIMPFVVRKRLEKEAEKNKELKKVSLVPMKMPQISPKFRLWLKMDHKNMKMPEKAGNEVKRAYRELCRDYRIVRSVKNKNPWMDTRFLFDALLAKWGAGWKIAIPSCELPTYKERHGEYYRYSFKMWRKKQELQYGLDDIPF